MNLRQQITEIGMREFGRAYVDTAGFPAVVRTMAERMLVLIVKGQRNPDDLEARAVVRAVDLFRSPGYVTEDEPAIKP